MRVMHAGKGYEYLLRSVARGDGDRAVSTPLTRYYTESGTPPGRWLGRGVAEFGTGELTLGAEVTESQLALLLGMGRDPLTGNPLGRAFPEFTSLTDRIAQRTAALSADLSHDERAVEVARIQAEETARGSRRAVAGYDFTFSVPKSVSVLWGVADAHTQALIADAHHAAVRQVVGFIEKELAATRRGLDVAREGPVAQVDVIGVAATAYDHWDSRDGDPQLHTHVVISNKVKTAEDGRWRSLDGRPLHAAVVALSEHYNAVLADRLTATFGVGWDARDRGKNRNRAWEVTGVSEDLIGEFSSRSRAIDLETDRLIAHYVAEHRRRPSRTQIVRLRAQATLATRREKQIRSLADLTHGWRARAAGVLGEEPLSWARALTTGPVQRMLRADDVPLHAIRNVGSAVVGQVSEKRSTWSHWNLWAEASRQTMGWRFASVDDREAVVQMIVETASAASVALTPPELAVTPVALQRQDGTSVFRPRHSVVFSSTEILAAENRLLDRADTLGAPVVGGEVVERIVRRRVLGQALSREQAAALAAIATSGRHVDLLIGPAGAGKTTAMRALLDAWVVQHGPGSVVGLAPSAAAAQVLADDLGIGCDNTAKWLHEHTRGRAAFRRGQLVIIDEATLAGTLALDRLSGVAAAAGAKVLLVGDWAQLQSVDAGGAFAMLASARDDTPELTEVHRFRHEWEEDASLDLRHGRTEAVGAYLREDRVREGTTAEMIDDAYAAWWRDTASGLASVLVAEASQAVVELNQRARAERIQRGLTSDGRDVTLNDGTRAASGDLVITRRNQRQIRSRRGDWVRNGDRWQITNVRADGSVVARRQGHRWGATVLLPSSYVAEHVDLGYAVTAHRAQGITVDTSHVVVTGSTTRENLYVSMTRGRESNIAYVALDKPDDSHAAPHPDETSARSVLYGVLQHSGAELSAHQRTETEQNRWSSIAQLAAEYETLAAVAQHDRWAARVRASGLTQEQADSVIGSDSFGPLTAELRRAEAFQYDVGRLMRGMVARRSLADADDIGAVLVHRLRFATARPSGRRPPNLIAGLIPPADGAMDADLRQALEERQKLIEQRARTLAEQAVRAHTPWLRDSGLSSADPQMRARWFRGVTVMAAYRDRYGITTDSAMGERPTSDAQRRDAVLAQSALRRASYTLDPRDSSARQLDARTGVSIA